MRFTVSRALDTIEQRLTTDPVLACAVVDLAPVVRHAGLDNGRPANLLRLGMVIDALARHLSDDSVAVYPVADRGLLSDLELTSNEKMVIRRWADDGLAEVVADTADTADGPSGGGLATERVLEIAALTGLPLVGERDYGPYRERFAGIVGTSRHLVPMPGVTGGATLAPGGGVTGVAATPAGAHPVLRRLWRCPEPQCASFGAPGAQPPPRLGRGQPTCPRHGHQLTDAGAAPEAAPMVVVLAESARHRFVVRADRPVPVGRNPEEPGVRLGLLLDDETAPLVSRSHLRMELAAGALTVVDTSTNGTAVLVRTGPDAPPQRVELTRGERRVLGEWDTVELHPGVELASARHWRGGTVGAPGMLAEAPTMAFRIPPQS